LAKAGYLTIKMMIEDRARVREYVMRRINASFLRSGLNFKVNSGFY